MFVEGGHLKFTRSSLNPACLLSAPIDRDLSTCRIPDLSGIYWGGAQCVGLIN